jgi:hypothetical protein
MLLVKHKYFEILLVFEKLSALISTMAHEFIFFIQERQKALIELEKVASVLVFVLILVYLL